MKFDWYQASVPEVPPEVVMNAIAKSDMAGDWEESLPSKGYSVGAKFVVAGHTLFKLNHGGQNEEYGANITGSGSSAPPLAKLLRSHFPSHRVSRLDACEDFHHPDVYAYLRHKALNIARQGKVRVREIVKPLSECDDGSTLYIGAPTSSISGRIYQKGLQLGVSADWVRVELQVRPQKDLKQAIAYLDPLQVWGLSKWSHQLAVEMGNKELQRVDAHVYQQADDARAWHFMLKQYGPMLKKLMPHHGSWEAIGAQIGYDLENMEQLVKKPLLKPL